MSCSRSHRQEVTDLRFEARQSCSRVHTPNHSALLLPSGDHLKMLPRAQVLAQSGDISALFPAWLSLENRVGRKGGMKRKFQHALAGSSPRTSPSALPALPRIPGPHLWFPPSLEGVEEVLSSWGALVGARGLLPSPHSRHCRAGQSQVVSGQPVHSFIHSFKAMHWGPTPHA